MAELRDLSIPELVSLAARQMTAAAEVARTEAPTIAPALSASADVARRLEDRLREP